MADNDKHLTGKVALVTGAGRGIGRGHALALAAAGARLVINDVGHSLDGDGPDASPAAAVVEEIRLAGGEAVADYNSVADWDSAKAVIDTALSAFGRLDIVVNNAGISRFGNIDVISRDDWDRTIAVNLTGTGAITHWASAHWRSVGPQRGRAIVNTSSPAGVNPLAMAPAYCAAKAGVAALTITSATELASLGVRVNAIAPMARTRMVEAVPFLSDIMNRREGDFDPGDPANISPVIVYLASEHCRFTGRVFGIEGADLFLFDGWSAEQRFNNSRRRWTVASLSAALDEVDIQDRGKSIAPATHESTPQPSDETLASLREVEEV